MEVLGESVVIERVGLAVGLAVGFIVGIFVG